MAVPWECDRSERSAANLAFHTAMQKELGTKQGRCADMNGFSLQSVQGASQVLKT
jgi:hypothetical protein